MTQSPGGHQNWALARRNFRRRDKIRNDFFIVPPQATWPCPPLDHARFDLGPPSGKKLAKRISSISDSFLSRQVSSMSEADPKVDLSQLTLSEGAFNEVLKDKFVQSTLSELDIDLGTDNASLFNVFKTDGEGQLPLTEMLVTMMKVRGDTSKADFIGPSVLINTLTEAMHGDIHDLQQMILANNKVLQRCQRQIRKLAERP
ncbi:unnamed protein product [Prorocentrum cordatum]|uniref:EF-hand domain-containing protein n=1 Tax=Prorocentrum cordatum TaxID=2364126 RepID=A0ABN9PTC1_9DINO|nr:unnamed protein product [Polarella glacialis]